MCFEISRQLELTFGENVRLQSSRQLSTRVFVVFEFRVGVGRLPLRRRAGRDVPSQRRDVQRRFKNVGGETKLDEVEKLPGKN